MMLAPQPTKVRQLEVIVGTLEQVLTKLKEMFPIESPNSLTSEFSYTLDVNIPGSLLTFEKQIDHLPIISYKGGRIQYGPLFFFKRSPENIKSLESIRVEVIL